MAPESHELRPRPLMAPAFIHPTIKAPPESCHPCASAASSYMSCRTCVRRRARAESVEAALLARTALAVMTGQAAKREMSLCAINKLSASLWAHLLTVTPPGDSRADMEQSEDGPSRSTNPPSRLTSSRLAFLVVPPPSSP